MSSISQRRSFYFKLLACAVSAITVGMCSAWTLRRLGVTLASEHAKVWPASSDLTDASPMDAAAPEEWFQVGQQFLLEDLFAYIDTPDANLYTKDEEVRVYRIETGESGNCIASWRQVVRLPPGNYRFTVEIRGEGVRVRSDDGASNGATIGLAAADRPEGISGSFDWQEVTYDFRVRDVSEEDVELVSELRASGGWSEMRAPNLIRLPD